VTRSAHPSCSVVIPVFNRSDLTRQCLDTLLADEIETSHEIIVVDDASTDRTPGALAGYGDAVRVVRHETNTGFATSCNDGAAAAAGEYLVFLNNDTLPLKGWLDALVRYADREPKAAVVGSKLLFPDNTVQHAGVSITEDLNPRHIYAGFPADHPAVNKSRRFPIVTAGCALFRRRPFEEAGGFDDAFENGFEDVDLCLRLGELGHEVHYCHEAVLYHLEKATRDPRDDPTNHLLYRRRWAHKVQPDAMARYIEDGLLKITFAERFPFSVEVSPLLALVEAEDSERESVRLLTARAKQVADLSRENTMLKLELAGAGVSRPSADDGASPQPEQEPSAMYLVSDTPGDPMRYRCDHHAEELELLGATARVSRFDQADLGQEGLATSAGFVLHRVPISEGVEWFIRTATDRNKLVLFDTDDLVFASQTAGNVLDLIEMPDIERQVFAERLKRIATTMAMCDAVLVTTEPLAELAREHNANVHVVPNAASREMLELADDALDAEAEAGGQHEGVTIAYLSGSPTHDRDFLQAADAVLWALESDLACRFLAVGNISLDSRFDRYRDRVMTLPIQPWRRLPRVLAGVDLSLAPLEPGNPFTEGKSCLKYIEAGLVGVPTIASPRADFVRAIEHGRNGLLADSPEEWHDALELLLGSSQLRSRLGQAAYEDTRARHTTLALAPRLYETIAGLAKGHDPRRLTVHWHVSPASLSSERASSLAGLVAHLRERNHTVRVFAGGPEDGGDFPEAALADVSVALDARSAPTVAQKDDALFKLYLMDAGDANGHPGLSDRELKGLLDLPLRPVGLGEQFASRLSGLRGMHVDCLPTPLDPNQFEQMLLAECFARAPSLTAR
jgi:GT2 family glycosyltransferase/glycosyltransferase involved in cell wall biosynthesis